MTQWTQDTVAALVGDASTLKDGRSQANLSKWREVGSNNHAAWGLIQGSGKDPYKTALDFTDTATKCSCPSRKFPCKHAVGLMFLLATNAVPSIPQAPDWVTTWLESRTAKANKSAETAKKAPDPLTQAKRQVAREAKVNAGIDVLRRWLEDLVQRGLGDPQVKTDDFWYKIAAQMVDAQMSPIASRLRNLTRQTFRDKSSWIAPTASEIGKLYALTEGYKRIDTLPESLQYDIRAGIGFALKQEEVIALGEAIKDTWFVAAVVFEHIDRLMEQRTWLYGIQTRRYALLLDFHPLNVKSYPRNYVTGTRFDAELVYYPSAYRQRAVIKTQFSSPVFTRQKDAFKYESFAEVMQDYANALSQNPFLEKFPVGMAQSWRPENTRSLDDLQGHRLPLTHVGDGEWYPPIAGGRPLPIFGEWNGIAFRPLTYLAADGYY